MNILTQSQVENKFGKFKYREDRGGRIIIDEKWIQKNICYEELPIVGKVQCHYKILTHLMLAFYYIEKNNLADKIDIEDFRRLGGCFVPRHKGWNPQRSLSRHSWGIAIDINVRENPYGKPPKQHPSIVNSLEKRGFLWGGRWAIKDGMHFEVSDLWKEFKPVLLLEGTMRNNGSRKTENDL